MLLQMHKQNIHDKDDTELVAQCDANQIPFLEGQTRLEILNSWIRTIQEKFPLGENQIWMMCDEGSSHFVRQPSCKS